MRKTLFFLSFLVISFLFSGCESDKIGNSSFDPPSKAQLEKILADKDTMEYLRRQGIVSIVDGAATPIVESLPPSNQKEGLSIALNAISKTADAKPSEKMIEGWEEFAKAVLEGDMYKAKNIAKERDTEIILANSKLKEVEAELQKTKAQYELEKTQMNQKFQEDVQALREKHKKELEEKEREIKKKVEESTVFWMNIAGVATILLCGLVIAFTKGQYIVEGGIGIGVGLLLLSAARVIGHPAFPYLFWASLIIGVIGLGYFTYTSYKDKRKAQYQTLSLQDAKNEALALAKNGDSRAKEAWDYIKEHLSHNEAKYFAGISKEIDKDLEKMKLK